MRLAIEANPPVYTNYLNGTAEAFALVKRLDNPGLAVNLDLSTMLAQGESLQSFVDDLKYVSHVHISEPGLAPIQKRPEHKELALLLGGGGATRAMSRSRWAAPTWRPSAARWIISRRCLHDRVRASRPCRRADYRAVEFEARHSEYCLLIPVINEGARILTELGRAQRAGIDKQCDIVLCDGGSTDGSMKPDTLAPVRGQHAAHQDRPRQTGGPAAHGHLLCPGPRL